MGITTKFTAPAGSIAMFVQSFWMLENNSRQDIESTVLPDGVIDLFLYKEGAGPMQVLLKGIDTEPSQVVITSQTKIFAIGFKLPAVEYLFHSPVAGFVNEAQNIPGGAWQFEEADLDNFELFCEKATHIIHSLLPANVDSRKKELFDLIYSSNGSISVKGLSEKVYWSARQINRYFNQQFGISLKVYCNILRFRASFKHIKEGKLFPEENFFDQAHFIKEVKKLAGVLPKELMQNKNGRFLQFAALPPK